MFDYVEIAVKAGNGGDGAVSFHREKFVPFGGPDGGDGGKGGDVVITADRSVSSLRAFKNKRFYRAASGRNGSGNRKHGKAGVDLVLAVPPGTIVSYKEQDVVFDLEEPGQQVVVARGGGGGGGNVHFASSTNQAPQIAQGGETGEEASVILEMKLIADAGIIGYPNAGKSTLLAAASGAKPEIAGYPFTTVEPALGVVEVGLRRFVLAEIPGLIAGAHLGRGLGHDFLRHVARTRVLIHLVDASSASPVDDMVQVNEELILFDSALSRKPQLVAVNKIDLPEVKGRLAGIKEDFGGAGINALFISAATGEGVPELMAEAVKVLDRAAAEDKGVRLPRKVFHPLPRVTGPVVQKEGDVFVVLAPELERIIARAGVSGSEVRWQLKQQFARKGVNKILEKAGIKPGDRVLCGSLEWEW